jgi:hypothetical protein
VFWFLFWFDGGLTQIPTTWPKPIEKRIIPNPFRFFNEKKLVREAGVEPTTFGSGEGHDA